MPSPFPGVDPYLESPDIWPDFHEALAAEIRRELNRTLPKTYYARLEMRPEIGIVGEEPTRAIVPDVTVAAEPIKHPYVEIRDARRDHRLVTLIEIVSPSNKRPGADRRAYQQKQREVLESDANLVEIDLHRSGERLLANLELARHVAGLEPPPDYLIAVNRAAQRVGDVMGWVLYPVSVGDMLPVIPIPLRPSEQEAALDVQWIYHAAYDSGPYRRGAVDYAAEPSPPLAGGLADWLHERLAAAGLRAVT